MTINKIYFAQHGLAMNKTEDSQRPLSEPGMEQTLLIARQLRKSGSTVSRIFHSGKLRAIQTAEIFAATLNITSISTQEGLSPNDNVSLLAESLSTPNALYIGHLPHLEKLVSYLLTGNEKTPVIKFQNSAILCLAKNNNSYHICWYLTPELLT